MKKYISIFCFLFAYAICNAAWICYPPYLDGNGPHCFGSNGSCSRPPWSRCGCTGSDCCCYGSAIKANVSVDEFYPIDNFGFEENRLILYYKSQVVKYITLDDYLDESELFVPNVVVLESSAYLVLKIYDSRILNNQVVEIGRINPELAYRRSIKILLNQ